MTIPEQVGKVATGTVEALKTNPSCLAAILLAALFAGLTFFALQRDADRRSKTTDLLLERCYPLAAERTQSGGPPNGR